MALRPPNALKQDVWRGAWAPNALKTRCLGGGPPSKHLVLKTFGAPAPLQTHCFKTFGERKAMQRLEVTGSIGVGEVGAVHSGVFSPTTLLKGSQFGNIH